MILEHFLLPPLTHYARSAYLEAIAAGLGIFLIAYAFWRVDDGDTTRVKPMDDDDR